MENGREDVKRSIQTFLPDAVTSSRFLYSFQGYFYPGYPDVPFLDKRVLMHEIPEDNKANGARQFLSSLLAKKKLFQLGNQHRTREGKSWALACEGGSYGGQNENTRLSLPFVVHTKSTECNSPGSRDYSNEIIRHL